MKSSSSLSKDLVYPPEFEVLPVELFAVDPSLPSGVELYAVDDPSLTRGEANLGLAVGDRPRSGGTNTPYACSMEVSLSSSSGAS